MSQNSSPSENLLQSDPKPLTRRNSSGDVYRRSDLVEQQLRELLGFERTLLAARLIIKSREDKRFLLEETLVYLMREAILKKDWELSETITTTLFRRCERSVKRRVGKMVNHEDSMIDCTGDILSDLFGSLGDVSNDKTDFAQVRFNLFVKRIISRHVEHAQKKLQEDRLADSIDETTDEDTTPHLEIAAAPEFSYENREFIEKALSVLNSDVRTAFVLKHFYGWQIDSDDPQEPTIAKYFGKTEKTIRNWLKRADSQLKEWRAEEPKR